MLLRDGLKDFRIPVVPARLMPLLTWTGTCQLTPKESACFKLALMAFDEEFSQRSNPCSVSGINIVITDRSDVGLILNEPEAMGQITHLAIYPVFRWREKDLSIFATVIAILEELCHHFYAVDDELQVERYVVACIRRLWPGARPEDVYNPNWTPDGSR